MDLSRFGGEFAAASEVQLSMAELLGLVEDHRLRQQAIACCLSGAEGWREAVQMLGGSFASGVAGAAKLSSGKGE